MSDKIQQVIIIGSGPAGLTAAIYAARAKLNPIIIAGNEPGGQLMTTTEVENFPGYPDGIQGPELIQNMIKQAQRFGATIDYQMVIEVDFKTTPLKVKTAEKTYQTKSVIVATGSTARWLGIESETRLRGKGVSACATCDGPFFKDKKVFVVGGGDSAMEEANFLTRFAAEVTIIHRRKELKASKIMQEKSRHNPKIKWLLNSDVVEVLGEQTMTGLKIKNTETEEITEHQGDGLFLAIGHNPNTKIFEGQLDFSDKGYLKNQGYTSHSNVKGVFIAGDVFDHKYRQAITAAGFGCVAAIDAEKYLAELME